MLGFAGATILGVLDHSKKIFAIIPLSFVMFIAALAMPDGGAGNAFT